MARNATKMENKTYMWDVLGGVSCTVLVVAVEIRRLLFRIAF